MRRFLPYVAVVWGAAIGVFGFITGLSGSGSYGAGQFVALLVGVALFAGGIRALKHSATSY